MKARKSPVDLREYDGAHLRCRFRRHRWDVFGDAFFRFADTRKVRWIVAEFHCDGCGLIRLDFHDGLMNKIKTKYQYPDGYLIGYRDGDEYNTRHDFTVELARRTKVHPSRDAMMGG